MDKNSDQDLSFSTNDGFVYEVVADSTFELFQVEPYRTAMPKVGELTIESEFFNDHRLCQDDVSRLLVSLATQLRQVTGKRYVIATKYNPMHDEEVDEEDTGFGPWEEATVLKMYLADAAKLKNDNAIDSSVTAIIRAKQKVSLNSVVTLVSQ